ncbi:probable receptor-like serine/threonine-protein kinase At5g57670 isoform X1 [Cynara cardunculus var. scolymus]|uniref:probable receptor-like serine/threonine-protein kinase At5g57670 isoform X1 n=1 Tax=Cynara cardunculus var. scolymus TaxID=59895 RepID=UPI000D62D3DB|nr:probable receptor-like serine/threonine-protein kinase At5g57670 isoform X1 [Cynara cardunculus var. scolymus]
MTQSELAGEYKDRNVDGGRTVVVGVKLDSPSRELLTWALVKAAHPGDRVIALHVLTNNEIVDPDGKSSLLSLVKAFDSILAVYEGFCNLKQVDLKLKICRGNSARKILVREAKSYGANEVIVGTAITHHAIKSSSSVAKYCARKLSKNCSIIAVNNGKIVFHRDSRSSPSNVGEKDHHKNRLLSVIHRSLTFNPKLPNNGNVDDKCNQNDCKKLELALVKTKSDCMANGMKYNCSICSPDSVLPTTACVLEETGEDDESFMALVPVKKLEASSSSRDVRPGWPLLRRAISSNRLSQDRSPVRQISVVQWAMRLPTRNLLQITNSDLSDDIVDKEKDRSLELNGENGAIVLVHGDEIQSDSGSPLSGESICLPEELEGLHEKYSGSCRLFRYQELVAATMNFKPENMIGRGGNSEVYKGCLPDGRELAVKILKTSEDVLKEFVLEIEIITALHHENIISLFGFCFEDSKLLLVYDLLSRGSLEDNLHGHKKDTVFGWNERYKVAVGVAKALVYLHNNCDKHVIHRDVKSSNILLSDDFEPQLSDFGLAKWATPTGLHITCTDVAGTFGYLAPEYFMHGKVTEKIDVYAFGVVLLELLTRRKPITSGYPKGEESLVMWAKPILSSGKFARLLDPSLGDDYDFDQMERMALASTLCIRRAPRARPQMTTILKLLGGDVEVTKWARLEVDSTGGSDARLHISNIAEEEEEGFSQSNLRSHLNLALLDIEDSSLSMSSSIEDSISIEDYLRGRWSRSSSFD